MNQKQGQAQSDVQLVPVSRLRMYHFFQVARCGLPCPALPADMYRAVFPFGLFNALQSICFPALVQTKDNVVCPS